MIAKTENAQKKSERRGNVLDIAIILAVLAILLTAGYRLWERQKTAEEQEAVRARVVFTVESEEDELAYLCGEGDTLYLEDGTLFGLLGVDDMPTQYSIFHVEDGETDGSFTCRGVLTCTGCVRENGCFYLHGDIPLTAGRTYEVHTALVAFTVTLVGVGAES